MRWCQRLVMHEYNECYLYHSCLQSEEDAGLKKIWERHLDMEIAHLHSAIELMKQVESKDATDMLPKEFPALTIFQPNIEYVRSIIEEQSDYTADESDYVNMSELPKKHRYFTHQKMVNEGGAPSETIIERHIKEKNGEYRSELKGPHPLEKYRPVTQ